MSQSTPHVEFDKKMVCDIVVSSSVRPATAEEIKLAVEKYAATGECDCSIVVDEHSWLYDYRSCFVCGKGLGTV